MQSSAGRSGGDDEVIGEEKHLTNRLLSALLEGATEGAQAAFRGTQLLVDDLHEGACGAKNACFPTLLDSPPPSPHPPTLPHEDLIHVE